MRDSFSEEEGTKREMLDPLVWQTHQYHIQPPECAKRTPLTLHYPAPRLQLPRITLVFPSQTVAPGLIYMQTHTHPLTQRYTLSSVVRDFLQMQKRKKMG